MPGTLKKLLQACVLVALTLTFSAPMVADNEDGVPIEETPWSQCSGCQLKVTYHGGTLFTTEYVCAPLPELQTQGLKNCTPNGSGCSGDSCVIGWA